MFACSSPCHQNTLGKIDMFPQQIYPCATVLENRCTLECCTGSLVFFQNFASPQTVPVFLPLRLLSFCENVFVVCCCWWWWCYQRRILIQQSELDSSFYLVSEPLNCFR